MSAIEPPDSYGLPYVEVLLNDQGPFWLQLDTGTYGLLLADDVAAQLAAPAHKGMHVYAESVPGQKLKSLQVPRIGHPSYSCLAVLDTDANVEHLPLAAQRWKIPQEIVGESTTLEVGRGYYELTKVRLQAEVTLGDTRCRIPDPVVQFIGNEGRLGVHSLNNMVLVLDQRQRHVALVSDSYRAQLDHLLSESPQNEF